jgi:hypothetical protein
MRWEKEGDAKGGLPGALPAGERVLWQGAPNVWSLFMRAFHARIVVVYFAALAVWRLGDALASGGDFGAAMAGVSTLLPVGAICLAIVYLMAVATARAATLTITSARVVIRAGAALHVTTSIPFGLIAAADLNRHADGTGDIVLRLAPGKRVAYFALWPFARPLRVLTPEPCLRCVKEPERVASILAEALAAHAGASGAVAAVAAGPAPQQGQPGWGGPAAAAGAR